MFSLGSKDLQGLAGEGVGFENEAWGFARKGPGALGLLTIGMLES